ncbi:serine/threonine protein kinase [Pedobacter caeni]|uniref:Serine/threonine protein kinase n=1 Tax=Pedobacter caeni TaxID=288992 RepID=A0A1M4W1F5_9SPHI|nr:serine/threonine-protein kinase [Pedobacter caeni]SHE75068.1 serine/threonine protein kinase [Pedobacter caeni]
MSKIFTIAEGLENMGALRTGGQGSVYKGKRMGTIITAVKIIPTPIHSEDTEDKNYRNFKNEVEKLEKVNQIPNPNVVKILNSGLTESGSFPFIEMEYIEGPDLEDLLKPPHSPVFTIRETIKLAEQLSNALAHCHKVGVKHGDIKSNNVKFNVYTGNYILLDFGLAIMSDEQRRSSVRHAGAVEFMAPEQHDGEMFFQTDIYSFGVILFELLAGTVPFPLINKAENSRNSVMLSHMEKPVPDPLSLRRNQIPESWAPAVRDHEMKVPMWLLELISKCLEKAPEKRFANGEALHEAIARNNIENMALPVAAAPVAPVYTPAPDESPSNAVKVSKPLFILMILALVGLSAFTGYALLFKDQMDKNKANAALHKDSTTVSKPIHEVVDTMPEPDTTNIVKPIILDTTEQQTNVDSLQKEYERQMGLNKPVPKKETNVEAVIVSEGKKYKLPKTAIYFYDSPSVDAPRHGVLGLWVNTKFTVVDEQNGFIYVTHKDNDGQVTKGWLNKSDLKEQ